MENKKERKPAASIVIPVFNNWNYTNKCLASLMLVVGIETTEIIIVDNGSDDETKKILEKDKRVSYIRNNSNVGFARACNQGAQNSNSDIIIFLNNDTEVKGNWLLEILKPFKDDRVAIVGSRMIFPDGRIQHAGVVFSSDLTPRHIYYKESADYPAAQVSRQYQAVSAASMAVKKNLFLKVKGFDEKYINGLEDVDFCLKIKEMGYKVIYNPESILTHHESKTPGRFAYNYENSKYFLEKWSHINPDEDSFFVKDGYNHFQRAKKHLDNYFVNGSIRDWDRGALYSVARFVYLFPRRLTKLIGRTK